MARNNIDLGIIITVATTASGFWYILLQFIINLSSAYPTHHLLLCLGIIHGAIFSIALLSLLSLYLKGLQGISIEKEIAERISNFEQRITGIIFKFWLPIFYFCCVFLVAHLANGSFSNLNFSFYLVALVGVLVFIISNILTKLVNWGNIMLMLCTCLLTGFLHMLVVSELAGEAKIRTDKEFYSQTDTVRGSIQRSGYILLPKIDFALFQFYDTIHPQYGSFAIDLSKVDSMLFSHSLDYISVTSRSQIFGLKKTVHHQLLISP